MKKVVIAFDGSNFSEGAFEFVRQLNELETVLVTGCFIPQIDYTNLWSYSAAMGAGVAYIPLYEENEEDVDKTIAHFEAMCLKNGLKYRVHKDVAMAPIKELRKESRFADFLVIGGELFYKGDVIQPDYIANLAHNAECPVLIVPEKFQFPSSNILAYNGTDDCAFAIKQFAYIFPEFANLRTMLVYADEELDADFPAKQYIIELATQHFPDLTLNKLELNPKYFFNDWMKQWQGSILVTGSFGRSALSQTLKKSFVSELIEEHNIPLFIAHK
jgi:nucleotide-binding universal stress UspA family protein